MDFSQTSPDELRDLLTEIRSGRGGLERVDCAGAKAWINPRHCASADVVRLNELALRPPAELLIHKHGSRSIVGEVALPDGGPVVLKYYYPKGVHKRLSYGIKGTRCRQSWIASLMLERAGIPTPPVLMIAEWSGLGGFYWHRSFLAMRRAAGITLKEWVGLHESDAARTGKMAETLKTLFARMAMFRIGHGDLKATNLLVDEHDAVSFIDLDATTCLSPSSRWADIRARDKRIFQGNWKAFPRAQEAFSGVFES